MQFQKNVLPQCVIYFLCSACCDIFFSGTYYGPTQLGHECVIFVTYKRLPTYTSQFTTYNMIIKNQKVCLSVCQVVRL